MGTVDLEPNTRLRIVATSERAQRVELARGTVGAHIVAPPRVFVVATPRLVVTDLGCAFTLSVDEAGRGRLVVTEGRVAVADAAAHEVVVAAGWQSDLGPDGAGAPRSATAPMLAPSSPAPMLAPPAPTLAPPAPAPTPQPATKKSVKPAHKIEPLHKSTPAHKVEPAHPLMLPYSCKLQPFGGQA